MIAIRIIALPVDMRNERFARRQPEEKRVENERAASPKTEWFPSSSPFFHEPAGPYFHFFIGARKENEQGNYGEDTKALDEKRIDTPEFGPLQGNTSKE